MEFAATAERISERQREQEDRYDFQTQFSELVDGSMQTSFELISEGHDLYGEDGRSMSEITKKSLAEAREIAKRNPKLWFEVRRRSIEEEEKDALLLMAQGEGPNTLVVTSDFPAELLDATEDVGGYNVTRKQAMLRVLIRQLNGNIRMYSQSLDGSNRQALEAIYARFGIQPAAGELLSQRISVDLSLERQVNLVDELTGVYDRSLTAQYGGQWYAGRRPADYHNTYEFVCRQNDLIEECVRLKGLGWLTPKFMYSAAATMEKRFKAEKRGHMSLGSREAMIDQGILYREIEQAGHQALLRGMLFSACGVTLGAEGLLNSTESQMDNAGYGNKPGEDQYGSRKFKCSKGHDNIRPHGKLIANCQSCGISVRC